MKKNKRGKHRSACPKSERAIKRLERNSKVLGTKFGATDNCRTTYTPGHLKFQRNVDAGIKINAFTENGLISVYVYCNENDREYVKSLLDS